jgi:galactose-6-phosphate isomerase
MPYLDVSDCLLDPDFCDSTLSAVRSSTSTNAQGLTQTVQTTCGFAGVVTSDAGIDLERGAAGEHGSGSISIITRFGLRAAGLGVTADVVTWNGRQYTVVKVNDYSTYGIGFIEAICDLYPLHG